MVTKSSNISGYDSLYDFHPSPFLRDVHGLVKTSTASLPLTIPVLVK